MDAAFPRHEAELALLEAALSRPDLQATIDFVRLRVACPDGVNPKNFGKIPTQLKANGIIRKIGLVYTKRRVAHGRDVGLWRIIDVEVARKRVEQLRKLIKEKTERAVATTRTVQKQLF